MRHTEHVVRDHILLKPKAPACLHIGHIEDKLRVSAFVGNRNVLDHGIAKKLLLIPVCQKFPCCFEGCQHANETCANVDCLSAESSDRLGNDFFKIVCPPIIKPEFLPAMGQYPHQDRTARDAGNPVQLAQEARLIKTPERAETEQGGAIASSRECKPQRL